MRLAALLGFLLIAPLTACGPAPPPDPVLCTGGESGDFDDVALGLPTNTPELEPNRDGVAPLVRANNGKTYLGLRIDTASEYRHSCLGQFTQVRLGSELIGEENRELALTLTPAGREITAPFWIELSVDPPGGAQLDVLTGTSGQQQSATWTVP